ncbi:MAG: acetate--CoA ligase family protein [Betaproteobacteria bacterium]|nr:acetate--CoA ligase family protein [Betaproteobacteria bacterium]
MKTSGSKTDLQALLAPRSIAVLGASSDLGKLNGRVLKYLRDKDYSGRILPINPKYTTIGDLPCYADLASLPEAVDLAIIALPARQVAGAIRECGRARIPAAIVFSSGFSETGAEGRMLEAELVRAAREAGVRMLGPNNLGLINAFERVLATFSQYANGPTPAGPIGFVTQSGAFGTAIAALARQRGLGLGYFVNTGNEADISLAEVMAEVVADERIRVGAAYIEGFKDGPGLLALAATALTMGKPLVLTKVGRSSAGARAAASHTGSLAGADAVFDGIARQFAMVRARNEEHMLDLADVLAHCTLPEGNGVGMITQSGGAGVLMADRAEELGLSVPTLAEATQDRLRPVIPAFGATGNPVDVTAQFLANPSILRESVITVLEDPGVHVAVVWLQLMETAVDMLVGIFEQVKAQARKPFVVCWVAAPEAALLALRACGIAVLRGAEPAIDAVAGLIRYAEARRNWLADAGARAALKLPAPAFAAARGPVNSTEGARLLAQAGVHLAPHELAQSADAAVAAASRLGYPVALKIESPDILHKTEAGGVRLNLVDANAVRSAFAALNANARSYRADARIDGVLVQAMSAGEVEFVIGLQRDPVFGIVVMAGLGGVLIEVLKDVAFRRAPVSEAEALRMLDELRGRAVLDGVRGKPPVHRARLAQLISAVSCFGAAAGERLRELDLNPVLLSREDAVAVDWLMVLDD